ncbi:plasmid stabilization protein [Paractinoplanes toevensis]|nr:plasmid stabilization protein [Actinoplanes toevensis]
MANFGIRDLDDSVSARLIVHIARSGRSAEGADSPQTDLFRALLERFAQLGGIDLDLPDRRQF